MSYRNEVIRTMNRELNPDQQTVNAALGLCGEAGEVADLIKKAAFQGGTIDRKRLMKELGDVRWYMELLCIVLATSMEEVEEGNVTKLQTRYPNGFNTKDSNNRKDEK